MKRVYIKPHYIRRNGRRIYIRGHYRTVITSLDKGRTGKRFKRLAKKVEQEYRRKGYSLKRARQIGRATAGKIFWQKYGKKKGREILRRER